MGVFIVRCAEIAIDLGPVTLLVIAGIAGLVGIARALR